MTHNPSLRKQIIAEKGHDPYEVERPETVHERIERIKQQIDRQNPDSTWLGAENGDILWMVETLQYAPHEPGCDGLCHRRAGSEQCFA